MALAFVLYPSSDAETTACPILSMPGGVWRRRGLPLSCNATRIAPACVGRIAGLFSALLLGALPRVNYCATVIMAGNRLLSGIRAAGVGKTTISSQVWRIGT
jgi:hypothetical protein